MSESQPELQSKDLPLLKNRYQCTRLIQHRGGQRTYLAQDLQDTLPVVIKQLQVGHIKAWSDLELFEREVQTLASLNHPHIPRLLDHFREGEGTQQACYLVQSAIAGHSLRSLLDKGPLPEDRVKDLALQLLQILSYLQSLNPPVIHRDIKPENILIDTEGQAHLVDFGAVRDATLVNHMTVAGTFGYMPPEQAAGQVKKGSDLYALAITCIECLSGTPPHAFPQDQQLRILFHDQVQISKPFLRWLDLLSDPVLAHRPVDASEALNWLQAPALPEEAERLQISYPNAQQVLFRFKTKAPLPHPRALLWLSLQRQFSYGIGLGGGYILFMGSLLFWGINGKLPGGSGFYHFLSDLHPFSLGFLAIWGRLTYLEYQALKEQRQQDITFSMEGPFLRYKGKTYPLQALTSIEVSHRNDLRTLTRTQTTLRFGKKQKMALPICLSPAELQLLRHAITQHAQTVLNPTAYQQWQHHLI